MDHSASTPTIPLLTRDLGLALGGPAALGLALGLSGTAASWLQPTLTIPGAVLGTATVMLPALYIGGALAGTDTSARRMLRDAAGALREVGIACVGLAPAVLFLNATAEGGGGSIAVGFALVFAALVGLRGLYVRLLAERLLDSAKLKGTLVFAAWALVALGIGARLAFPAFA